MKQASIILKTFVLACFICSCGQKEATKIASDNMADSSVIKSMVLTKAQQQSLSPDTVIAELKQGNHEFVNDQLTVRNNSGRIREASLGQYPAAVILSCLDSRVPVEDVFHRGIGDLFVARVAGNIVNVDILGSLEYACKVSGSKVIVVLGHEYCGAIKSAIDNVKLGNITALLAKIRPAVDAAKPEFKGDTSLNSKNEKFVEAVCKKNVTLTIENIRKQSPILAEMEKKGEIKIVGAEYHMKSGVIEFL